MLDQVRHVIELADGHARVELTVDDVTVVAEGRRVDRFAELEAELMDGDEAALHRLGAELEKDPAVTRDGGSKLERAMQSIADAGIATPPAFGGAAERARSPGGGPRDRDPGAGRGRRRRGDGRRGGARRGRDGGRDPRRRTRPRRTSARSSRASCRSR